MTGAERAFRIAERYGATDGAHHKAWVIDQMVRALFEDEGSYLVWRANWEAATKTLWDEGIAP